ncbi:MAG: Hsp20/alpha crystallin family protein [Thermoplasmata archaeon]|nr:Hsp20/alpha crystallin family protein [Thermoplasmata archaeon]OYT49544.1 MAG: heat-shock protein Hsp20 [Thermoplasmatales archaeon ex4484_36]RLF56050.1 MAG: Hsp20/alpha crystallin family protein [Thermoplasmata archaeon]RLF71813.1 MAG: Hsp20/alpha crystallin family protein [Thermoplasmata archaeon]RLF73520.1 MAG: Hsp20/alpha crystallin family protein [Thermoplasmata archaeon]
MIKWNPFRGDREKDEEDVKRAERRIRERRYPFWGIHDDDFWDFGPWGFGSRFMEPFGDLFSDLRRRMEREFRRMEEEMNWMMRAAQEGRLKPPEEGGPIVYGFSMRIGPDGRPHVQEFGNVRDPSLLRQLRAELGAPGEGRALPSSILEPLTDVMEDEDKIIITFELPGVEKKDIDLEATEDTLVLKAERSGRKYFKEVPLPEKVKPDTIEAKYNNGVLEVTLKRAVKRKKGKKIPIK